jgi:hypothetical protein
MKMWTTVTLSLVCVIAARNGQGGADARVDITNIGSTCVP